MIVIPMAGLSSRFTRAGYDLPKYMLPLNNKTVFDYSVNSFRSVYDEESFLFVSLARPGLERFLNQHIENIGIKNYDLVILDAPTEGQADTVAQGLTQSSATDSTPITIFNIDTFRKGDFTPYNQKYPQAAGVLEVFRGSGDNWSFVKPDPNHTGQVHKTAEKIPISDLCCSGMYYFSRVEHFLKSFEREKKTRQAPELYVAPMYNHLISDGETVCYDLIDSTDIVFCGVPEEYKALQNNKTDDLLP